MLASCEAGFLEILNTLPGVAFAITSNFWISVGSLVASWRC